ncbi:MAG TPA: NADPH-dependent assimilatory sulfite reductase hemoprotein subunit [Candidatus Sumerlaeota bacterium]|nr:NADPH-dependent assimilatory sulfite reductase hemoprotein subunit [Candidatus Sumerlaeota bacterium]
MADQTDQATLSKVEFIKENSDGLRGTIEEVLNSDASHFEENDLQLLKFHGSYQQDDRDLRAERRKAKLDKAWIFMVRAKIPGGRVTAEQFLDMLDLGCKVGNGSIRITSRQGIQFHGVGKENLRYTIRRINQTALSTLGACGDVNRNVMCCGLVDQDWRRSLGMEQLCLQVADHFTPHATGYWEIWCDGERFGQKVEHTTHEPIYGARYMPRKFKIAVTVPEDNCVDVYTNDLGVEVVHHNGRVMAYDLIVGGGMGFAHGNEATYPRLGTRMVRVTPAELLEALETVLKIQRDYGDRSDRKHARLKYVVEQRGAEWFRDEMRRRTGRNYPEAGPLPPYKVLDHLGWEQRFDGRWNVGIHIDDGRVRDRDGAPLMTGLRRIVERFRPQVRMTPRQDVVLVGIDEKDRPEIQRLLDEHGLETDAGLKRMRRLSMACVALPTCGLALAESERYMPSLLRQLDALGVGDEPVEIRMTGCPNSCVRSPLAEIGVVGRGPGKYALYLGGNQEGTRLAFPFLERVDDTQLAQVIFRLIDAWRRETGRAASFGDWSTQKGCQALEPIAALD